MGDGQNITFSSNVVTGLFGANRAKGYDCITRCSVVGLDLGSAQAVVFSDESAIAAAERL